MAGVADTFTRTAKVSVIGEPEIWNMPGDRRLSWHIYKIAGTDNYALISYGNKHPGVRPGVHGVFTGGTKEEYSKWLTEHRYRKA